ncbi:unnamed protein product [Brassicogethes aeneus]|uniref:Sorting nexin-25 n=1 Tax=Brassicogethes aeneus TaxID=1431903 RepID=A0A9P0BF29_BRAAE|nr:unnamed protein product [Brassicogethes aeneus]
MNTYVYLISALIGLLGSVFIYPLFIKIVFYVLLIVLSLVLGVICALWINLVLSSPHKSTVGADNTLRQLEYFRNKLMKDYDSYVTAKNSTQLVSVFGRTVDSLLQQLLDFILRDYVSVYIKEYAYDAENLEYTIKEDMWGAIQILHERFARIDEAKLIAIDMVTKLTEHFENIREAKTQMIENVRPPEFRLSNYVLSEQKEYEYLRNMSELFIMFLLPRSYSLSPTKHFIREILTCKVFKPFIENITDPDFFNRNVIIYIEAQENESRIHVKGIENAHTFGDVIKIIHNTNEIEALKSLRYNIVTKLMQATTLQNLNRAKGVDLDNDKNTLSSAGVQKSDINEAKKLRKLINQMTYAKKECEKKLTMLGWDLGYQFNDEVKKILPLATIMEHVLGRKYLTQFLETLASQDLVRYWISVEELRTAQRKNWHQLGAEIFYTFIRNPTSEIKVDKNTRKRMEAFLLGDKGPDVFYEVQCQVVQTLEDKYYQPFLISDYYKEMIIAIEKEDDVSMSERKTSLDEKNVSLETVGVDSGLNVGDHSNYAKRKLYQLQEKYMNKSQALSALRNSLRPESKILNKLEKEVEWLQGEQRQLEAHLNRTEVWGENLGKWRANVQSAEIPDEKEPPQFVLVVQMENDTGEGEECISTGWVVCRSLGQFQELHKKLRPMCSDMRNLELPSNTFKFLFGKIDKATLERAKQQIQKYLDFVLKDERLNQSEAIYSFLSPSSEHLKQSSPNPKKSRFFFSTLFKSTSEQSKDNFSILKEVDEDDISQSLESTSPDTVDFCRGNGNSNKIFDDTKDTIAEPLYALLSELFDMKGFFKYLRKTLIGFVQVTYGKNINKQIHETINWYFSEQMLHYYITLILKSYWPGGALVGPEPIRSDEEKLKAAKRAQELFVNNVPELLTTLVGNNAAKNGARKVFEALQDKKMNKQLFYELFEVAMDSIFPELN